MSVPDPSSPGGQADWFAILTGLLPYVDIFIPSAEEILYMLRRQTFDELHQAGAGGDILALFSPDLVIELSEELLAMGVKIAGLKLGPNGFYMQTGSETTLADMGRARPSATAAWAWRQLWAPAFQVTEVGTTGAGDAAYAGFLAALLRDLSPEEALTMAVAVGACNIEATDSLSGIQSWEETQQRVAGNWPRRALTVNLPGWQFDTQHQLWTANP
jgi:sugar/nucleoside kinase (ribokinase family)